MRPLVLIALLVLSTPATAEDEAPRPTPPPDLGGAALAEYLRTTGCPGCLLQGSDLAGQNLDGANLAGARLDGVDLTGATCHGCKLEGAHIAMAQLDGADLDGADLRRLTSDCSPFFAYTMCQQSTENPRVTMRKANLAGADLSGIVDLDVTGAKVEGATFHVGFPPSLAAAEFDHVELAPEYGSEGGRQTFDKAEIKALAGFVQYYQGSWVPLSLDFGEAGRSHSPSFDCAKASSDTEKALCQRAELALLDRMLAAAYKAARDRTGADEDALKTQQLAWIETRNACGAEWGCLSEAMRSRIGELLRQAGPGTVVRTGEYEPSYAEPKIAASVGSAETRAKLRKLMRFDATSIEVEDATGGVMKLEAFALGGNGHMCSLEGETFLYDEAKGRWYYGGEDADGGDEAQFGVITAVDRYLLFDGGQLWCGARASLDGIYVLPP